MTAFALAKALHIFGVVLWIGGVAFVTLVLIPSIQKLEGLTNPYEFFEIVEQKFAWQARFTTLLTGGSGFYLIWKFDLWSRFGSWHFWWMHAMVIIWLIFTLMLFVLEPFVLHKVFKKKATENPQSFMNTVQRLHYILLTLSLVTLIGAMIGAH